MARDEWLIKGRVRISRRCDWRGEYMPGITTSEQVIRKYNRKYNQRNIGCDQPAQMVAFSGVAEISERVFALPDCYQVLHLFIRKSLSWLKLPVFKFDKKCYIPPQVERGANLPTAARSSTAEGAPSLLFHSSRCTEKGQRPRSSTRRCSTKGPTSSSPSRSALSSGSPLSRSSSHSSTDTVCGSRCARSLR